MPELLESERKNQITDILNERNKKYLKFDIEVGKIDARDTETINACIKNQPVLTSMFISRRNFNTKEDIHKFLRVIERNVSAAENKYWVYQTDFYKKLMGKISEIYFKGDEKYLDKNASEYLFYHPDGASYFTPFKDKEIYDFFLASKAYCFAPVAPVITATGEKRNESLLSAFIRSEYAPKDLADLKYVPRLSRKEYFEEWIQKICDFGEKYNLNEFECSNLVAGLMLEIPHNTLLGLAKENPDFLKTIEFHKGINKAAFEMALGKYMNSEAYFDSLNGEIVADKKFGLEYYTYIGTAFLNAKLFNPYACLFRYNPYLGGEPKCAVSPNKNQVEEFQNFYSQILGKKLIGKSEISDYSKATSEYLEKRYASLVELINGYKFAMDELLSTNPMIENIEKLKNLNLSDSHQILGEWIDDLATTIIGCSNLAVAYPPLALEILRNYHRDRNYHKDKNIDADVIKLYCKMGGDYSTVMELENERRIGKN